MKPTNINQTALFNSLTLATMAKAANGSDESTLLGLGLSFLKYVGNFTLQWTSLQQLLHATDGYVTTGHRRFILCPLHPSFPETLLKPYFSESG